MGTKAVAQEYVGLEVKAVNVSLRFYVAVPAKLFHSFGLSFLRCG